MEWLNEHKFIWSAHLLFSSEISKYLALNSQPSPLYSFSVSHHLFPILASFDSYLKTQLILLSESLQFHIIVLREAKFLDPEKADKVSS